jgi:hypothetical protein
MGWLMNVKQFVELEFAGETEVQEVIVYPTLPVLGSNPDQKFVVR